MVRRFVFFKVPLYGRQFSHLIYRTMNTIPLNLKVTTANFIVTPLPLENWKRWLLELDNAEDADSSPFALGSATSSP
jgi:hypothetical protein